MAPDEEPSVVTDEAQLESLRQLDSLRRRAYVVYVLLVAPLVLLFAPDPLFLLAPPFLIVAVILSSFGRRRARGTFLESHFRWQIRTVGFAILWLMSFVMLFPGMMMVGPVALTGLGLGLWVIYRVVRGWLNLKEDDPVAEVKSF